ncbi:NAD(P)/FAD-dependent oxidoreductase [Aquiflexum sp. LQ15W]|uniref:NAD(P)/FAD-dependent oxidoreductase n=1 Tax=Cognataquiflexum nitidum TaxID=2922272 RepID=UPI001F1448B8|nr:NAD(P)/FAD-dependent oxidoreductase [Cognataquiflexum nitidum]MCH6200147.1 NAD(P)/FAD-dependent oxidoreductase [Cognataquiflexum nitidum]
MQHLDIIIIGGGLGGLIAAHQLAKNGREVLLIEKKKYPFHRVCGEYISNEVKDFLLKENLFPQEIGPSDINKFQLSSIKGNMANMPLDLGGFGISRYAFDLFLYQKASAEGVTFMLQTQVEEVGFEQKENRFFLKLSRGSSLSANHVIGAFGKRSKVDKAMDRHFMHQRSPFIGVKYHVKTDFDPNTVALHNFEGGYCGLNQVESGIFNLCYLGSKEQLRHYGSIPEMEKEVLHKNPHLRQIFQNSEFLFDKPEVINEINFSPKQPVEDHILMVGDAAGLITPLCGNGMAIAIHTGKLAAEAILLNKERIPIESQYRSQWDGIFKTRLWIGRKVQWLFGSKAVSEFSVGLIKNSTFLAKEIMKMTHGERF